MSDKKPQGYENSNWPAMKLATKYPEYLPISSGVGATLKSSIRNVRNGRREVIMKVLQKTIEQATIVLSNGKGVTALLWSIGSGVGALLILSIFFKFFG